MFWMVVIVLLVITVMENNPGAAVGALSFAASGIFFAYRKQEKR